MNWDAIAAIVQMLGSVAVLITLWYLALQVRHAREQVARSVAQGRTDAGRELAMHQASNQRGADIAMRANIALGGQWTGAIGALTSRAGLTLEDAYSFNQWQFAWWNYRQQVIENIADLPAGQRVEFDGGLRAAYGGRLPALSLWFEHSRPYLNPDAVHYIDNLWAQPG